MKKCKKLLIILMTLIMIMAMPLTVSATSGDNADGGGSGGASSSDIGGASASKSGYRMYVVDYDGNLKSKVIDLVTQIPVVNGTGLVTRIGSGHVSSLSDIYIMDSNMPRPFIYSGAFIGNGLAVKEWMRSKNDSGEQNICAIIYNYLGEDILNLFRDTTEEMYLCIEPIAWHNLYATNDASSNMGISYYGTFYNWMVLLKGLGFESSGFTRTLTNNVLGRCMTLAYDQANLGLVYPTSEGNITLDNLGAQGWGMQIYRNIDVLPACTTFDELIGNTPHKAPDESVTGEIKIVKNYRTKTNTGLIDDGCFVKEQRPNEIVIEDEIDYKVIEWQVSNIVTTPDSTNYKIPGYISDKGKTPKTIMVKQPGKVLYVLLQKENITKKEIEGDYQIEESWITKAIDLSTSEKGEDILNGKSFNWNYNALVCPGHEEDCGCTLKAGESCTEDHTYSCTHSLVDDAWTFKIKNSKVDAFSKIVAYNSFWSDYTNEVSKTRTGLGSGTESTEHEYKMVIHRGQDELSIAKWKNENPALDSLDNFNTSNTESKRLKSNYNEAISLTMADDAPDKSTSSKGTEEGCTASDSAALSEELTIDLDIEVKTYSGKQNGGQLNTDINNSEMITSGTSTKIVSGRMIDSGLQFSFRPYIQMQYQTLSSDGEVASDKIFVLGDYNRSMKLNDYAEVSWEKSGSPNLSLNSTQWSGHATVFSDLGKTDCLLPGGATLSLSIKKDARQKVTVTTYQCILDGDGREQTEITSGETINGFTKETALQYHEGYVNSVVNGLSGLGVAQYQNKDYGANPFDGQLVYAEADISDLDNGSNTASPLSEKKYYFKLDNPGEADSGLLDVKRGTTNTQYYVFSSDIAGNILMNGSVILTKDQGIESLSGTAKMINSKTYAVTKLVDAIERNTGNDITEWASDGKWYNEAFD
ncbi:MAG: hypothetical protein J6A59_07170, partial [Lachnospiraceae bacterium]|nr:hypothetical protein [Lachnospiraceae bacterium]